MPLRLVLDFQIMKDLDAYTNRSEQQLCCFKHSEHSEIAEYSASNTFNGLEPWVGPAILLVDLDAFFASVEQLDHPAWRGKPVIVGGDAAKHGVVSTASYEARRFGVHSAMPASQAARLCPTAIWAPSRFDRYTEVSTLVMNILYDESPHVQQVSIDEAFVDVSPTRFNREHPVSIATRIQQRVGQLGVSCSIGVATTKTVAKIASDIDKPQGLTVVFPGTEQDFLSPLPVRAMSGIGQASASRLHDAGIETLGDIAQAGEGRLRRMFGKNGSIMYLRACGLDSAPVEQAGPAKSVSAEITFANHLTKQDEIYAAISTLSDKVGRRLRKKELRGETISLKIRFHDRSTRSIQHKLDNPTDDELLFGPLLCSMLEEIWNVGTPIMLVGVGVSGFDTSGAEQQVLFDASNLKETSDNAQPAIKSDSKRRGLLQATDAVKDRFGEGALTYGHQLRNAENTTGTSSKNPADYK